MSKSVESPSSVLWQCLSMVSIYVGSLACLLATILATIKTVIFWWHGWNILVAIAAFVPLVIMFTLSALSAYLVGCIVGFGAGLIADFCCSAAVIQEESKDERIAKIRNNAAKYSFYIVFSACLVLALGLYITSGQLLAFIPVLILAKLELVAKIVGLIAVIPCVLSVLSLCFSGEDDHRLATQQLLFSELINNNGDHHTTTVDELRDEHAKTIPDESFGT